MLISKQKQTPNSVLPRVLAPASNFSRKFIQPSTFSLTRSWRNQNINTATRFPKNLCTRQCSTNSTENAVERPLSPAEIAAIVNRHQKDYQRLLATCLHWRNELQEGFKGTSFEKTHPLIRMETRRVKEIRKFMQQISPYYYPLKAYGELAPLAQKIIVDDNTTPAEHALLLNTCFYDRRVLKNLRATYHDESNGHAKAFILQVLMNIQMKEEAINTNSGLVQQAELLIKHIDNSKTL